MPNNNMNPAIRLNDAGDARQHKNVEPSSEKIPKRMITQQLDLGPIRSPILLPNQRSRYPTTKGRSIRMAEFLGANNNNNKYVL